VATHDYVISNGTGSAVRSDLNGALAAIVSQNSNASEPATMYAYQWWADTTTGLLKIRNAANSAWVTIGTLASANLGLLSLAGGTMTGVLAVTAGTAALPGIAVSGDLNTGLVSPGADQLAITTGGTSRLAVSTTAVSSTLAVDVPLGAVGTPSITFTGDLNTGLFSPGADTVALATGGTNRFHVTSGGFVGIGTTGPGSLLDLRSASAPSLHISETGFTPDYRGYSIDFSRGQQTGGINFTTSSPSALLDLYAGGSASALGGWDGQIRFFTGGTNAYGTERARIDSSGRLLVGVSANANGGILQLTSGITFPATAVAASDVNTLDDYEEGTWTPTDSSGAGLSFTVASCRYTKIGRTVAIQGIITYPVTANTNNAQFTSFPFAAADNIVLSVIYSDAPVASFTYLSTNTTNSFLLTPGFNITNATMSGKFFTFAGVYAI